VTSEGFVRYKRRALALGVPIAVHLELTYNCRWRCLFCGVSHQHHDEPPLGVGEWLSVFDDLRSLGTLALTFTGGDPLEHPDFFRLAEAARERAFGIRIFTNGEHVDEETADRLADLRPFGVELSLHGATAEVHDGATGRQGSFDQVWKAVEALSARGLPVVVKTVLTTLNAGQLDEIVTLAARRGVPLRIDPTVAPCHDGDTGPLHYTAPLEAVERLMQHLAAEGRVPTVRERPQDERNCGLGRLTLAIDPYGDVFPCMLWRSQSLGNVRQSSLTEIWARSPARSELSDVALRANRALREIGGPLARYPFCPALALQLTGDPLQPDPPFIRNAHAADAVRGAPTAPQDGGNGR
jgi:MoaA/NifB/PqqE/SkfB family radical SAM enzyme